MNETQALAQTNMFGVLDQNTNRVFKASEIKAKDGSVVGAAMTYRTRKEIGEAFNLKGKANKDALDTAMLKESDEAFRRAKAFLAGVNGDNTLAKFEVRTLSSGVKQGVIKWREIPRSTRMSDEKLAQGMFPAELYPAMTLDEKLAAVVEMRSNQEAHLAKNLLDS